MAAEPEAAPAPAAEPASAPAAPAASPAPTAPKMQGGAGRVLISPMAKNLVSIQLADVYLISKCTR